MNVQMVLIFVNTTVIILMEVMSVIVNQATSCPMDSLVLISMNVIVIMVVVIILVSINQEVISVNVILDSKLIPMEKFVLVIN